MIRKAVVSGAAVCFAILLAAPMVWAQPEKGAVMISGTATFARESGELYGGDEPTMILSLGPTVMGFLSSRVAIGGELNLMVVASGGSDYTDILVGPALAYYFPSGSKSFPVLGASFLLQTASYGGSSGSSRSYSGNSVRFRVGWAYFVRPSLALTPEFNVSFDTREEEVYSYYGDLRKKSVHGTVISFGMGISGLLGKDKK